MVKAGIAVLTARAASHAAGLVLPALLLWVHSPVAAVSIKPIMVELTSQKKVASVRLLNDSTEAVTFQAETLSWQQSDGEDQYGSTQELIVAPAIALIAPGASQIFRVTLRQPAVAEVERAYRLVLEDISTSSHAQPGSVNLRFRHSLPLFVTPRAQALVSTQWSRCAAPASKACVQLDNLGNRRVRVSTLAVEGPDWRQDVKGGGTVLAGASRRWLFDLKAGLPAASRVIATSDSTEKPIAVELR